jgi:PAS domain S-box-containing protein
MSPKTTPQSTDLFHLVVDSVEDFAVFMTDMEGRVVSWNPGVGRILGYAEEEFVGQHGSVIFTPEDRELGAPEEEMRTAAAEGRAQDRRWHVRKDGSHFWADGLLMLLRDGAGGLHGFAKILRDNTEARLTEERLRESEERYQRLVELSPDAIAVHADGVLLFINTAGARLLGADRPEQVVGRPIAELVHPDSHAAVRERLEKIARGETPPPLEVRFVRLDGGEIYGELASAPLLYRGRSAVQAVVRDLTRRRRYEEERERLLREAQEANRLKDEFLATLSHELRTPLTAILGWARLLRGGEITGEASVRALETIERNARAQAQLIDDMLDVSRIVTGKLRLDVAPIDPRSFIDPAVEAVRPAAEAKGVTLRQVTEAGGLVVVGDPARLQQVVWNLLTNAVKFTPAGGSVEVRLGRAASYVEIVVSDTGAGIDAEFLPHVFERFRQADQHANRRHGGLGLGLSIVRHLVELHGGTVSADSAGAGAGATFTVTLPVSHVHRPEGAEGRAHPATAEALSAPECPERLDGLKVLVVDDEADARELLAAGLSRCGAQVVTAASADEALDTLAAEEFDALVSDIGMPGMDGHELIRRVRALPPGRGGRTPAVAVTAYARAEDRLGALRAGFEMHVPKPVELAELVVAVAHLVRRARNE